MGLLRNNPKVKGGIFVSLDGAFLHSVIREMEERKTKEARMYKALDNMEAVIQHNESDISTWLPLEYELQQTYGMDTAKGQPLMEELRAEVLADTLKKIEAEGKK